MAIDTAAKRRGASGIPSFPLGPGVTPDSDKDTFWRQTVGWGYGGIAATDTLGELLALAVTIDQSEVLATTITQTLSKAVTIDQIESMAVGAVEVEA